MSKLRYYAAPKTPALENKRPKAAHSEFLRTGKIIRDEDDWLADEKRYLTHEEVAVRTAKRLEAAAETTHQRINGFHKSIRFPKLLFHQTLQDIPHLGYCHVTASRSNFAQYADVKWAFYFANFNAEVGGEDSFFQKITPQYGRMYFAVALKPDKAKREMTVDRSIREDGLLFRTSDPKVALKNVLLLGARTSALRKIIASM
ncbi:hypothetical protein GOZ90_00020 [Agrobacterium vitis]|uniref:Uncharacterized protein n=1 Tax=Agrobacterium vitis TaxID=373 RepID=A0A368NY72_AGRVI|nr:DUF6656 family protein [Agrobacterium vitis]KAA3519853.1 hypothetical protein DXM22_03040 [Agrobacterium vitis]KAA3531933.1 hypothetical protein DXT89_00690 [Agrobacterium vitis]MCF1476037.1 hypothetical protein [Agrobacterium vitis]MUZ71047.1 hypothetical protein [Agrobacterium vitis]MUZ96904.1 hypothetical protein [Agrobacterium vitis]